MTGFFNRFFSRDKKSSFSRDGITFGRGEVGVIKPNKMERKQLNLKNPRIKSVSSIKMTQRGKTRKRSMIQDPFDDIYETLEKTPNQEEFDKMRKDLSKKVTDTLGPIKDALEQTNQNTQNVNYIG